MKNVLVISDEGEQLLSSVDDGSNSLVLNDTEVDSSEWVGTGNYTTTLEGQTISVKRIASLSGNIILVNVGELSYELRSTGRSGEITLDAVYPVGSIYMSVSSTDPASLFGGTWVRIKDTFLLSAGDTYAAGATGGEAAHTLTANESGQKALTISGGEHIHSGLRRSVFGSGSTAGYVSGAATQSDVSQAQVTIPANATTGAVGTHSHSVSASGASQAHNNMPPYLAVYVWKRTA